MGGERQRAPGLLRDTRTLLSLPALKIPWTQHKDMYHTCIQGAYSIILAAYSHVAMAMVYGAWTALLGSIALKGKSLFSIESLLLGSPAVV